MITYDGSPSPDSLTARAVANAQTRLAAHSRVASTAATTPWVPAEVRCTSVRPSRSARLTATGEFGKSNPEGRRPRSSPIASTSGCAVLNASASSTVATK